MNEEEAMLKNLTSTDVLPLIGAVVLGGAFQRIHAQGQSQHEVRSEMLVSTTWLEQHLNDRGLIVLFVGRDRSQFDSGHIPGSHFVRLDDLVEQRKDSLNELPPVDDLRSTFESIGLGDGSRIVLTDEAGGVLAARAYFTLDYLGYGDHASLLDGGSKAWIAESRRTSKDDPPATRAEFSPHVHPEVVVSTAQMGQLSLGARTGSSDYVLLDARPVAEYTGVVNSESVPQAGHIAGSQSLYWKNMIRSDANPRLLAPHELRREFMHSGADLGKSVVTYCRTGMQSSFTYFVAKYLGYRASMYDGSVYEWVRAAGNPLVRSAPQVASKTNQ